MALPRREQKESAAETALLLGLVALPYIMYVPGPTGAG